MKVSRINKVIVFLLVVVILVGVAVGIYFIVNKPTASKENPPAVETKTISISVENSSYYSDVYVSVNNGEKVVAREGETFTLDVKEGDTITMTATCIKSKSQTTTSVTGSTTTTQLYGFKIAGKKVVNFKASESNYSISFEVAENVDAYTMEGYLSTLKPLIKEEIK